YLGTHASGLFDGVVDDHEDLWAWGYHAAELVTLLRALRRWREAQPHRKVLIVSGDVHVGARTSIRHQGSPIFEQFITSAITNRPPSAIQFTGIRTLLGSERRIGDTYTFEHTEFQRRRNYGIILARAGGANTEPFVKGVHETARR